MASQRHGDAMNSAGDRAESGVSHGVPGMASPEQFDEVRLNQESASAFEHISCLERELQAYEAGVQDVLECLGFDTGRLRDLESSTEAIEQMKLGIRTLLDSETYLLERMEEMNKEMLQYKAECMKTKCSGTSSASSTNPNAKVSDKAVGTKSSWNMPVPSKGYSGKLWGLFSNRTSGAQSAACSEDLQSPQSRPGQGKRAALLTSNHSKTWSHLGSLDTSGYRFRRLGPSGPEQDTLRLSHAQSCCDLGSLHVTEDHLRTPLTQSDAVRLEDSDTHCTPNTILSAMTGNLRPAASRRPSRTMSLKLRLGQGNVSSLSVVRRRQMSRTGAPLTARGRLW